jgi:hypothetical protein
MAKTLSVIFGVVFVVVALLGFVQEGEVVGIFHTNTAHDVVHLVVGLIMIVLGTKSSSAATSGLKVFGVVYLLIAILGFVAIGDADTVSLLGLVEVDGSDNYLHLVLGVVLLLVGLASGKKGNQSPMSSSM